MQETSFKLVKELSQCSKVFGWKSSSPNVHRHH